MNTESVTEEATGMRNLDPSRPSPMVEAFAQMLDNQKLTDADHRHLRETLSAKVAEGPHAAWCVKDVSDEVRGMVCSSANVDLQDGDEFVYLGIDGSAAEPVLSFEIGKKDPADELPWMLFVTPEVAHTVSRLIRGCGDATANALDALIAQAEAAREAVR